MMKDRTPYHIPVLLEESMAGLNIKPDGIYVDATYGGGGHAAAILSKLTEGKLIAFDQDDAVYENIIEDEKLIFINANFKYIKNFLTLHQTSTVDGLFADLGISSHQIDTADRGFSTRYEGALDLRMNRNGTLTGKEIVNTYDKENLVRILKLYGELTHPRRLADEIIKHRAQEAINTTTALMACLKRFANPKTINKFFAQVFQALRIEVNDEIGALKSILIQSPDIIKPGGRLAVISYHSIEDRQVKNFMKFGNFEGHLESDFFGNRHTPFKMLTNKPITASVRELETNKRARSAKLRIAERL